MKVLHKYTFIFDFISYLIVCLMYSSEILAGLSIPFITYNIVHNVWCSKFLLQCSMYHLHIQELGKLACKLFLMSQKVLIYSLI